MYRWEQYNQSNIDNAQGGQYNQSRIDNVQLGTVQLI